MSELPSWSGFGLSSPLSGEADEIIMSHDMELIEATRARFRPERIMTLFVGESAPARGGFFYFGNNAMVRYVQQAIERSPLGRDGADILDRFKALGWFLDDLSLAPVDNLPKMERVVICRDAQRASPSASRNTSRKRSCRC